MAKLHHYVWNPIDAKMPFSLQKYGVSLRLAGWRLDKRLNATLCRSTFRTLLNVTEPDSMSLYSEVCMDNNLQKYQFIQDTDYTS